MKDLIWTLIIIWLIYKVYSLFRLSNKETEQSSVKGSGGTRLFKSDKATKPDPSSISKPLDKEGEYVEFEEVK